MIMPRRNESPEENAQREKIHTLLRDLPATVQFFCRHPAEINDFNPVFSWSV